MEYLTLSNISSFFNNNADKILVGIIVFCITGLISFLLKKILPSIFSCFKKIDFEYISYESKGTSGGIPIHHTFNFLLTNKSSKKRTVLWDNLYYVRIVNGKPKKDILKVDRNPNSNKLILEKNIPSSIIGEIYPPKFEFLKKIYLIDTNKRKWKMGKKSLKELQNKTKILLDTLNDAYDKRPGN